MGLLKMPIEIVCHLVELLDVDDVVNIALRCRFLYNILLDKAMCRITLMARLNLSY